MSGQQDRWDTLDDVHQLDPRDATLDLTRLIEQVHQPRAATNGVGRHAAGSPRDEDVGSAVHGAPSTLGSTGIARVPVPAPIDASIAAPAATRAQAAGGLATEPDAVDRAPSGGHSEDPLRPPANQEAAGQRTANEETAGRSTAGRSTAGQAAWARNTADQDGQAYRQPPPGSLADLRRRLEGLPFGHPSSPYHVDGERKPQPPRLKHLELAPPGREQQNDVAWRPEPPGLSDSHHSTHGERAPMPRSAATRPQATGPDSSAEADAPQRTRPAVLTQPELRIAQDAYDRLRAFEGRNLFGNYSGSGLTATMKDLERRLAHGWLAPDTDQRALLGADAFEARLAEQIRRHPDRSVELLARGVPGALSYTFVLDADHYAAGTWRVQELLQAQGFQLLARKNSWNETENKRVVTMWHDQASGLRFEVQFHTRASLEAQQLTRTSADLIADPRIPQVEADVLRSDITAAWDKLPAPPGNAQIGDYRRSQSAVPRR